MEYREIEPMFRYGALSREDFNFSFFVLLAGMFGMLKNKFLHGVLLLVLGLVS